MKYILSLLSIVVLFNSCEQTITIPIPDNGRKITLNSILHADSSIIVKLKESKHILSHSEPYSSIENADVTLFENDDEIGKLTLNSNTDHYYDYRYYTINYQLTGGNVYSIEATTEKHGTVSSKCTIPNPVQIENLKVEESSAADHFGYENNRHNFELTFTDPENEENFYFVEAGINVIQTYHDYETNEEYQETYFSNLYVESDDPSAISVYNNTNGLLISDEYFDGKNYTFHFYSTDGWYGNEATGKFHIKLSSISKEYYYYTKSYEQHKDALYDPFAEPVQVYSNIENGFGIMGGISSVIDSVEIEFNN